MKGNFGRLAVMGMCVCLGYTTEVHAKPPIWSAIRRPNAANREELIEKAQKAESDAILTKKRIEMTSGLDFPDDTVQAGKIEARELLEKAGGGTSPNMSVRLHYASLVRSLASDQQPKNFKNIEEAARIITTVITSKPPPMIALNAWDELALCYAVLGQREKEVHAYGEALLLEPIGPRRAMLLANRAESFMGMAKLDEAIHGYRESLATLLHDEVKGYGVTTFWGLAVALDRNGDLEDGLEHIRLARTYDEFDQSINSSSWFYSPPYDVHWYKALGDWARARAMTNSIDRTFEYGHALEAWDRYIDRAPADDPYVQLAKARRRACEIERERASRMTPKPGSTIWGFGSPTTSIAPNP